MSLPTTHRVENTPSRSAFADTLRRDAGAAIIDSFFRAISFVGKLHPDAKPERHGLTIDRDVASGIRLAGFLAGAGLVLGYAGAGDWRSIDATLADFIRHGWPAAWLAVGAAAAQWVLRPTPSTPRPPVMRHGVMPAAILLFAAIVGIYIVQRTG